MPAPSSSSRAARAIAVRSAANRTPVLAVPIGVFR